jgi:putative PIN family toxin of toxin-antitoxin system
VRIVLDTNVLVSGLLNPHGAPATIVGLVAEGSLVVCYDTRILLEYRDVLHRARFGFDPAAVESLLMQIQADGEPVTARPLRQGLADPSDEVFLEVAVAAGVRWLVTGNLRHFPPTRSGGVTPVSPVAFLQVLRGTHLENS